MASIGQKIKQLRKSKRLTQAEFAKRLNKTLRTVQKYESGEIEPSISAIGKIAEVLETDVASILGMDSCSHSLSFYDMVVQELANLISGDVCGNEGSLKAAGALVVVRDYLKDKMDGDLHLENGI